MNHSDILVVNSGNEDSLDGISVLVELSLSVDVPRSSSEESPHDGEGVKHDVNIFVSHC